MDTDEGQRWLEEFRRTWDKFGLHGLRGGMPKKKAGSVEYGASGPSRNRSIFREADDDREYELGGWNQEEEGTSWKPTDRRLNDMSYCMSWIGRLEEELHPLKAKVDFVMAG